LLIIFDQTEAKQKRTNLCLECSKLECFATMQYNDFNPSLIFGLPCYSGGSTLKVGYGLAYKY